MVVDCFPEAPAYRPRVPIRHYASINPKYQVKKGVDYPFLDMAAIGTNLSGIKEFALRPLEGSGLAKFRLGDTLFAKITPCPQNGKIAFVDRCPGSVGLGSTEFIVLSPRDDVESRFVFHLVSTPEVRGRAVARMEGSTGRQRVPDEVFEKRLSVPLFSQAEQRGIIRVLDAISRLITAAEFKFEAAKTLDHSLLHTLLESDQFCSGSFSRNEWKWYCLKQVSDISQGITLGRDLSGSQTVSVPYLRVANVQDGFLDLRTIKTVQVPADEIESCLLKVGDILMTEGGDLDKLGRGTIWNGELPTCSHQNHIFRVRLDPNKVKSEYLGFLVESDIAKRYFLRVAKRTTNLASINKTQLGNFAIPIPPMVEQERIVSIMAASKRSIAAAKQSIESLTELRRSMAYDLLTDSVDIDKLDFDHSVTS